MSARFSSLFALVVCAAVRCALAADGDASAFSPQTYDIARYEGIWKAQPFVKETENKVQSPGLAARYALVGLVESGSESVAFLDDSGRTFMLSKKKPDAERNLELVAISANKDFRQSTITIRQGAEQAELKFDPRGLAAMGAGAPVDAATGAVPPPPTGVARPAVIPPAGVGATPGAGAAPVRRIIPPPGTQLAPNTGAAAIPPPPGANSTGTQTPPTPTRRIIRPQPIDATP
jgi:hypothetical protein